MHIMAENTPPFFGLAPVDWNGSAQTAGPISLATSDQIAFLIYFGVVNSSATTMNVTLTQGTSQSYGTSKALAYSTIWTRVSSSTYWTKTTVSSNTYAITAVNATGGMFLIDVAAKSLDWNAATPYSYCRLEISSPGSYSCLGAVAIFESYPRITGDGSIVVNALA